MKSIINYESEIVTSPWVDAADTVYAPGITGNGSIVDTLSFWVLDWDFALAICLKQSEVRTVHRGGIGSASLSVGVDHRQSYGTSFSAPAKRTYFRNAVS